MALDTVPQGTSLHGTTPVVCRVAPPFLRFPWMGFCSMGTHDEATAWPRPPPQPIILQTSGGDAHAVASAGPRAAPPSLHEDIMALIDHPDLTDVVLQSPGGGFQALTCCSVLAARSEFFRELLRSLCAVVFVEHACNQGHRWRRHFGPFALRISVVRF